MSQLIAGQQSPQRRQDWAIHSEYNSRFGWVRVWEARQQWSLEGRSLVHVGRECSPVVAVNSLLGKATFSTAVLDLKQT